MQQIMVGIFRDHAQAEQAINELLQAGFDHHQIRFAGRGTSTGGILEKIKSLFTGQDTTTSGIYDDLVKMGVPSEDARHYQSEFEAEHSIVAVQANGRMQEASNIMLRHGGYGIDQRSTQSTAYGTAAGERSAQSTGYSAATGVREPTTEDEQRIKLREEELRVHKQSVETGEARLHKDVVVEQKSMDVPVTREEVYVEHRPGSGLPSDQPIGKGETYRIPVHEEQVTTEKRPIEREEVSFGKRPIKETQQVTDTIQREEAHVEYTGDVNVQDRGVRRGGDIKQGRDVKQGRDIERDIGSERGGDIEQGRDIKRDRGMEQGREY